MGIYRDLAKSPGVFRILLSQLTARLPAGMLSLTLLMHVQLVYGNYTSAGVALAGLSIGMAISGPISSRLMNKFGMRLVLIVTTVLCSALLLLIALTQFPLIVLTVLCLFLGFTTPPIMPAVRTVYPTMVEPRHVTALFSLDASAQEIVWVLGPVLAVFVSVQFSTVWGLLIAAAFMVGGGGWFITSPELGSVKLPPARSKFGAVLGNPAVVIATVVGALFVASFAGFEAAIVSVFGHSGLEAGFILAAFSVSSLIGGLMLGHRDVRPWTFTTRPLIVIVGIAMCIFNQHPLWLGLSAFVAGFGVAPMFAALFSSVSASVRFSQTAEAYGWLNMGQLGGAAAGSALAGIAIDHWGPQGGMMIATALIALTALVALACIKWIPDLKNRSANPIPDTEPIPVVVTPPRTPGDLPN